ncbi:MAG: hypothetical protein HYX47_02625 [Burkholderiales bacterium]|nr:hypothetical protein [Burkholderiales bacterium]
MQGLFRFLLRLVLVAVGLVFAATLLVALAGLVALWGARSLWARVTGRPVAPFVMRVDPRGGFSRVVRGAQAGPRSGIGDITDVEAKERL